MDENGCCFSGVGIIWGEPVHIPFGDASTLILPWTISLPSLSSVQIVLKRSTNPWLERAASDPGLASESSILTWLP